MIYLLLCILSSTGIFLVFKKLDQKQIPSFPVIVINYLVAFIVGYFIHGERVEIGDILHLDWLWLAVLIGILFIVFFFVIAKSSSVAGISITTVASKMSVVFPITYSMLIDSSDQLSFIKLSAIILALSGVVLSVSRRGKSHSERRIILIPIVLFVGMGLVDSLVKHAQHFYVLDNEAAIFSSILFLFAFLSGIVSIFFQRKQLSKFKEGKIWLWGLVLGLVNFGSIYFMVSALSYESLDSSVVFAFNNIGIVLLSVLSGYFVFKEKLSRINWLGIVVSLLAIILFSVR